MENLSKVKEELRSKINLDHKHLDSAKDGNYVLVASKMQGEVEYTFFGENGIIEYWNEKLN
jgi:hypothetical protein